MLFWLASQFLNTTFSALVRYIFNILDCDLTSDLYFINKVQVSSISSKNQKHMNLNHIQSN